MNINNIHTVYFIGIGGIGMSNLARYMAFLGKNVLGYDRTSTAITRELTHEGIQIFFDINRTRIEHFAFDKVQTLIVYTPAVKRDEHDELDYFLSNDFQVVKRSDLLGIITKNTICLAVAGTHGKTTTSTILGHILKVAQFEATSFLGGISENYHTNLILGGTKYTVVEADEYDRSFLKLNPDYACITAIDADHLDIYKDALDFEKSFLEFSSLVSRKLFVRNGIAIKGETYGIEDGATYEAQNIRIQKGAFVFDVAYPEGFYENVVLYLPGRHNVLNAMAALSLAHSIGVEMSKIAEAMQTFKGVERRFSYKIRTENLVLIDDYAHHPTELQALHNAVRALYPTESIMLIFQPHTYTRTRDFMEGFVQSLSAFDEVYVLPIYAAREHPIDRVSSEVLVNLIKKEHPATYNIARNQLFETIVGSESKVIVMAGAGDIGEMIVEVTNQLKSRFYA